ncbi:MAG: hypothetical protein ACPLXA_04125 [Moorellaceae bacterium]
MSDSGHLRTAPTAIPALCGRLSIEAMHLALRGCFLSVTVKICLFRQERGGNVENLELSQGGFPVTTGYDKLLLTKEVAAIFRVIKRTL